MISVALPALIVSKPALGAVSPKFRDVKGLDRSDARWGRESGGHRPGPRKETAPPVFCYLPEIPEKKKKQPKDQEEMTSLGSCKEL